MRWIGGCWAIVAMEVAIGILPSATGAPAVEQVLPNTTRLLLATPDFQELVRALRQTQYGRAWTSPAMRDFVESFSAEHVPVWAELERLSGLRLAELEAISQGEAWVAVIEKSKRRPVLALMVEAAGKEPDAEALRNRVVRRWQSQPADAATREVAGVHLTIVNVPAGAEQARQAVYFVHDERFVFVGDEEVAEGLATRWEAAADDGLATLPAYGDVMSRCQAELGDRTPHLRWFLDPFHYSDLYFVPDPESDDVGLLKFSQQHGLDAVLGIGGLLTFGARGCDVLLQLAIYAPKPYHGAMRVFDLQSGDDFAPPECVSDRVSTCSVLYWNVVRIIEHVGPVFDDEIAGVEGTFDDILADMRSEDGPGVDLRDDLFAHLGPKVTIISELAQPAPATGEGLLVLVETQDEQAVAVALKRLLRDDPEVIRLRVEGFENDLWEVPGAEFSSLGFMVANGHLHITTSVDLLRRSLRRLKPDRQLAACEDYQRVVRQLGQWGKGAVCFFSFSRQQRDLSTAYEALRSGQLEDVDSLYVKLLAAILDLESREDPVDFSGLPPFEAIREYLGLSGTIAKMRPTGWTIVGFTLPPTD